MTGYSEKGEQLSKQSDNFYDEIFKRYSLGAMSFEEAAIAIYDFTFVSKTEEQRYVMLQYERSKIDFINQVNIVNSQRLKNNTSQNS